MKPIVSLIAVMSENRVIGNKGRIPWHIREDLIRFRDKTTGHATIMGRITFESLLAYYQKSGRPWPIRTHIVVTRDQMYAISKPNVIITHSLEEALAKAKQTETEEIFIAGGAQIFEAAMKYADKLYLTVVKDNFAGDAYFPDYSRFKTIVSEEKRHDRNYDYSFFTLVP